MTTKEQNLRFLRDYLACRRLSPWVASYAIKKAQWCLQLIGGMAGTWRTDYSECTYYNPQRVNGVRADLSDVEKVRAFHELPKPLEA